MSSIIDYGVCRLSIVPVRKEPNVAALPVTQLLFGDHYEVLEESKDHRWLRITTQPDVVTGWIDQLHHHSISEEYFQQIGLANFKITTDVASTILYKKSQLTIVMGSIVPISGSELFKMEEQFAFNGETKSLGQRRDFEFLHTTALKYLNAPQVPGGKSPFGIDAPGLVQMVFKLVGYQLPRDIEHQMMIGKEITSSSDVQPGDIVFFSQLDTKTAHVGIALEEQKLIHCHGRVRVDHLMEEGILNGETKIYSHSFIAGRRILGMPAK